MRLASATPLALAALLGAAACGRSEPALADDLQRDLEATASQGVELAPRRGGTDVVSAIEGGAAPERPEQRASAPAPTQRAPRVTQRAASPQRTPVRIARSEPAPSEAVASPAPAERASEVPATTEAPAPAPQTPRPQPQPQQRAPRGGWWSTGDVIRNAPFPINP